MCRCGFWSSIRVLSWSYDFCVTLHTNFRLQISRACAWFRIKFRIVEKWFGLAMENYIICILFYFDDCNWFIEEKMERRVKQYMRKHENRSLNHQIGCAMVERMAVYVDNFSSGRIHSSYYLWVKPLIMHRMGFYIFLLLSLVVFISSCGWTAILFFFSILFFTVAGVIMILD